MKTTSVCGLMAALLAAGALSLPSVRFGADASTAPKSGLHYAPNGNFATGDKYLPGKVGFNLADVSSVGQLDALPDGIKGLAWIGRCAGVDTAFLDAVQPYIGHAKLFGFYLMDDPDPRGRNSPICTADNLKAESDWIHTNAPGAKTFILLMKMSTSRTPSFANTYNPTNSHVDLFGLDPYPCRSELQDCDYDMIDRYVVAAEVWGIPRSKMVPIYQAFGGGNWVDDGGGRYRLPTVSQEQQILARWGSLVATPEFDFAYSWGSQNADAALESSPELQAVFSLHNNATKAGKP